MKNKLIIFYLKLKMEDVEKTCLNNYVDIIHNAFVIEVFCSFKEMILLINCHFDVKLAASAQSNLLCLI